MPNPDLVSVREAANYLRVSARTVYRLIETGQINAVRIGKQWRIPYRDLPAVGSARPTIERHEAVQGQHA